MLILVSFCTFLKAEIYQNQKSRASKTAKMTDFELLDSPKLISRKILVAVNLHEILTLSMKLLSTDGD